MQTLQNKTSEKVVYRMA